MENKLSPKKVGVSHSVYVIHKNICAFFISVMFPNKKPILLQSEYKLIVGSNYAAKVFPISTQLILMYIGYSL